MSKPAAVERAQVLEEDVHADGKAPRARPIVLLAPVAVGLAGYGVFLARHAGDAGTELLWAALVTAWAVAGAAAALRRPGEHLGDLMLRGCLVGGVAVLAASVLRSAAHGTAVSPTTTGLAHLVLPLALGLLPDAGLQVLLGIRTDAAGSAAARLPSAMGSGCSSGLPSGCSAPDWHGGRWRWKPWSRQASVSAPRDGPR